MTNVNNLITDNINVWTSAIKKRNSQGRGSNSKVELVGIKKLRELILELAVRGKLVPQDPNDEPASVLLDRIAEEKAQLIADKQIKKQKALPTITDEEKPFELPNNWEWVKLDELSPMSLFDGDWIESKDQDPSGNIRLIQLGDLGVNEFKNISSKFINGNTFERLNCTKLIEGDILIGRLPNPIGRACLFPKIDNQAITVVDVAILRHLNLLNEQYLVHAINSNTFRKQVEEYGKGATRFRISTGNLKTVMVPVSPLKEQHRIVAKVDELMALCDQLEQQTEQSLTAHQTLVEALLNALTQSVNADDFQESWQRIADHFDVLFTTEASIDQLKQTILQLAVMGKLVPQNPSDEPACALLEKIAEEKAQLIKDKKIKKQKPLPAITDEEKPFELSGGWEWVRFENIAKNEKNALKAGPFGSALKKSMYVESGYKIYGQEQVISGNENIGDYFVDEDKYQSLASCKVQPDDILISLVGTIGKVLILSNDCQKGIINPRLVKLSLNGSVCKRYIQLMLGSQLIQDELFEKSHGSTMNVLNLGLLKQLIFPLPCTEEQHRIVAKVDELTAFCDQLKTRLADAQVTQLHLADAVVENALN